MEKIIDKRDLSGTFRERLKVLMSRSGLNQSAFAAAVGIDRSALSQLLAGSSTRLPRAETLMNISARHQVSLDWLLGLSQDEGITGELRENMEIAQAEGGFDSTLLAKWHAEAVGTKIRYVPSGIPDLLRSEDVIYFEADAAKASREAQRDEAQYRVDYNRRPETDMEVCMPRQTLELFASGLGRWHGLPRDVRAAQLAHMATLIDDLYPTFRLFLFDWRERFSAPYTIFGPYRAAIYMGGMYLVLNARQTITTLTRHFDGLIRIAEVNAHETAAFVRSLKPD
ncbi:helix-turn-helix domain-containing protein [Chelativorans xinjiangense]|uniref:helix-turn-helix domain-containing protein n=1 Tax=Chelativorans xinjiangense TaxID=2681485 RepID=UPI00135AC6FB|nr:helix-turn-helix transcriptional regulator [Chelativorans xinjiangense]